MKNITITLDDETAAWTRIHAARDQKSVSRFVGEVLRRTMSESQEYDNAMQRFLSKKPVRLNAENAPYPRREDLYDRDDLR